VGTYPSGELGGGLGLPRPPEPFHRVYSPPEPPPQGRRPTVVSALTAVLALVVVGAVAFMVFAQGDDARQAATVRDQSGRSAPPSTQQGSAEQGPAEQRAAAPAPRLLTLAPQACVVVSPATVRRLVPSATINRGGGRTASTCDYSGKSGSRFRELRVETQIFTAAQSPPAPVDQAKSALDNRWKDAGHDPVVRTVALDHVPGLGDEAFQRYAKDEGQPTVVGEVVMRIRNSLAVISYVEDAPSGADSANDATRQRCLSEAAGVAREIMPAFE
jgi:hypothetical protein